MIYNPLNPKKSYIFIPFRFISSFVGFVCNRGLHRVDKFSIGKTEFSTDRFNKVYMVAVREGVIVRQCGAVSNALSYDTVKYMHDHCGMDIGFILESNNEKLISKIKLLI